MTLDKKEITICAIVSCFRGPCRFCHFSLLTILEIRVQVDATTTYNRPQYYEILSFQTTRMNAAHAENNSGWNLATKTLDPNKQALKRSSQKARKGTQKASHDNGARKKEPDTPSSSSRVHATCPKTALDLCMPPAARCCG